MYSEPPLGYRERESERERERGRDRERVRAREIAREREPAPIVDRPGHRGGGGRAAQGGSPPPAPRRPDVMVAQCSGRRQAGGAGSDRRCNKSALVLESGWPLLFCVGSNGFLLVCLWLCTCLCECSGPPLLHDCCVSTRLSSCVHLSLYHFAGFARVG
jgi:hypothetical protein